MTKKSIIFLAVSLLFMTISFSVWGKKLTLEVTDLKSGKIKTKISVPMWVVKTGATIGSTFGTTSETVDIAALVKELEKKDFKEGPFLTIEDHEDSEKVSFSIE